MSSRLMWIYGIISSPGERGSEGTASSSNMLCLNAFIWRWMYRKMYASSLRNCPILRNSITRLLDTTFSISKHVNKIFKLNSDSIILHSTQLSDIATFTGKINLNNCKDAKSNFNIVFTDFSLWCFSIYSCNIYARDRLFEIARYYGILWLNPLHYWRRRYVRWFKLQRCFYRTSLNCREAEASSLRAKAHPCVNTVNLIHVS